MAKHNSDEEVEFAKQVGQRIVLLRAYLGMTQNDLAKKLKCARYLVSKWESGQYLISTKHILTMCKTLAIPLAYFDLNTDGVETYFKQIKKS